MAIYERQTPETSLMCRVVARQWPRIVSDYNAHGVTIPSYVSAEVERFLRCGILLYGFLLLRCPACDAEKSLDLVAKRAVFAAAANNWLLSMNGPELTNLPLIEVINGNSNRKKWYRGGLSDFVRCSGYAKTS